MSEFWNLTPRLVNICYKNYEEMLQADYEKINYSSWLTGQYVMAAIGVFLDKRNKYPDKPFELKEKGSEVQSDVEKFGAWAVAFNKTVKGGDE